MNFYRKFSDQDLIESYKNQIDYQGKATQEILEEITSRGTLEDFLQKINAEKIYLEETNRIIRIIHQNYIEKISEEDCFLSLQSEILAPTVLKMLVSEKYKQIKNKDKNLSIDSDTILKSILGLTVAPIISTAILLTTLYKFEQLIVFNFFLLIPVYIINYFVIKFFVKKTRENLAVFITTFLATIINVLFFILFLS